jgi:Ca2+-binding EF-hand superfamily protein
MTTRLSCGALFDKIDSRSSGLISVEEFGAAISRILPKHISERQTRELIRSIDTVNDIRIHDSTEML